MTINGFLVYSGAAAIALLFLYSTRNIWISLIAGFIAFCVFYFAYSTDDLKWDIAFLLQLLKEAAIIYIIAFALSAIFYKIFPVIKMTASSK